MELVNDVAVKTIFLFKIVFLSINGFTLFSSQMKCCNFYNVIIMPLYSALFSLIEHIKILYYLIKNVTLYPSGLFCFSIFTH